MNPRVEKYFNKIVLPFLILVIFNLIGFTNSVIAQEIVLGERSEGECGADRNGKRCNQENPSWKWTTVYHGGALGEAWCECWPSFFGTPAQSDSSPATNTGSVRPVQQIPQEIIRNCPTVNRFECASFCRGKPCEANSTKTWQQVTRGCGCI